MGSATPCILQGWPSAKVRFLASSRVHAPGQEQTVASDRCVLTQTPCPREVLGVGSRPVSLHSCL